MTYYEEIKLAPETMEKVSRLIETGNIASPLPNDWGEKDKGAEVLLIALLADERIIEPQSKRTVGDLAKRALMGIGFSSIGAIISYLKVFEQQDGSAVLKTLNKILHSMSPEHYKQADAKKIKKLTIKGSIESLRNIAYVDTVLLSLVCYGDLDSAIYGLKLIKSESSVYKLISELQNNSSERNVRAFKALTAITGKNFLFDGRNPKKWEKWWDENKSKIFSSEE